MYHVTFNSMQKNVAPLTPEAFLALSSSLMQRVSLRAAANLFKFYRKNATQTILYQKV